MSFLDSTYLNYKEDKNIKSYLTYRTLISADEGKYLVGNIYAIISPTIEEDNMELYYDLIPDSIFIEENPDGEHIGLCAIDYMGREVQIFNTANSSLTDSYFIMQLIGAGQVSPEWITKDKKVKITLKWFDRTYTFITDHPKMIKEVQDFFEEYDELQSQLDKLVIYV